MPLHAIQQLPGGARLGLWHLRETPAQLWPLLPHPAPYRPLLPAPADPARQAQWLAARVLTQGLLAAAEPLIGLEPAAATWLTNDADGRPQLTGRPTAAVSLSHSGEWVAALLAPGGRVGVDVEQVRDKARRLAPRFLSAAELAWAEQPGTDPAVFSLLWSAKESLYKLAGQRGLVFREDILTQPFKLAETGELMATLRRSGGQTRHRVCYVRPAPGYVLTHCSEPAVSSLTSPSA